MSYLQSKNWYKKKEKKEKSLRKLEEFFFRMVDFGFLLLCSLCGFLCVCV